LYRPGVGVKVAVNFTMTSERAAMLVLPHGADRNEKKAYGEYRDYIIEHAQSWYKYLNVDRKREARNGSLYLVTGCDKGRSWGLAAGSPEEERELEFSIGVGSVAGLPASGDVGFHASWRNTDGVESRHYPTSIKDVNEDKNQCVFARGFVIGINENFFKKKFKGKVRSARIDASSEFFPALGNNVPLGSLPRLGPAPSSLPQSSAHRNSANESGPGDLLNQEEETIDSSDSEDNMSSIIIRDYPEYPKPVSLFYKRHVYD
jgi:hypothetical protein